MNEDYVSVDTMAEEYRVSRSTAWRWVRERNLPTWRFVGSRKTYVKRSDLAQLAEPIPVKSAA